MSDNKQDKLKQLRNFERLLEKQTGKAVRPYRSDGYTNLLNNYATNKDTTEHYHYRPEPPVPDDYLTMYYEGNGLFAKIIDTPAEEAVKHGFTLEVKDQSIEDFYTNALDELDWEETVMTAIKWARLFGGSIIVMLINDGRGLEEPVDWKNIKSIDDLRVYDRSVIQEDTSSMFNYRSDDPFRTRSSRLGMPEYYDVYSQYGNFRVHDSRCLVFQNGILPENTTNSIYQLWGVPEYIRINKAIRDAEIAHGSAPKLLDRSVQAVYKMKDLSAELATEQGEERVLRRLQTIDMARGLLNSITIDAEGEDYDFRTFQFSGVSDVIDSACNYLSALTSIPQTILFGRSPAGMNSTGDADLENWYNYLERIQSRMIKKNLRYLLSVVFQAGVACGEVDEVPDLNIKFNPLWNMSDSDQAAIDQQKAQTQQIKAQTAQLYMDAQVIDPSEVRKKLADSDEFDIENMLDEYDEDELFANMPQGGDEEEQMPMGGEIPGMVPEQETIESQENPLEENVVETKGNIPEEGSFDKYAEGVDIEEHNTDPGTEGSAPTAAPAATKLPQDMSEEEKEKAAEKKEGRMDGKSFRTPITYQEVGRTVNHDGYNNTEHSKGVETPPNSPKASELEEISANNNLSTNRPKHGSVGVLVIKDGCILSGTRLTGFNPGLVCGPGGHVEDGETHEQAAIRETQEEFGITPKDIIQIGFGPWEPDTGLKPAVFLATEYEGDLKNTDGEMGDLRFRSLAELQEMDKALFQPFADAIELLLRTIGHDHFDGGPGSGNHGHKGVPGQRGGSAGKGSTPSASDFKGGSGDFEVTGDVSDMHLTSTAKSKVESATKKIHTASDLKSYLEDKGVEMVVDYKPLQDHMDREIASVKEQADYIVAAIEQYEELGGLSALKAVHVYNPDLDAQAQYSYRATGEDDVEDEGHLYISDRASGFQIMHEFAHAYADSTKPEGMDVVEWSAKLNKDAGLSDSQGAYFGASSSEREAERFADAVGSALCYGEGSAQRLTFLSNVASIVNGTKSDSRSDGIMSLKDLAAAFAITTPANGKTLANHAKSDMIKGKGTLPYGEMFKELGPEDLDFLASEFGVTVDAILSAPDDMLRELCELICEECENQDGGPGSGNWGHEGRPGELGGSAKGGGSENRQGSSESGYTSSAKKAEYKARLKSEKESLLSQDEEEQATTLWDSGYLTEDEAVDAMDNGTLPEKIEEYYSLLEENGDTTSEKPTTEENDSMGPHNDIQSGKYKDYSEARIGYIKETTGLPEDECLEIRNAMRAWTSSSHDPGAKTEQLDKFIENDSTYDGTIYRGLHFGTDEDYEKFMENVQRGSTISANESGMNASWSSLEDDAVNFSHRSNQYANSVVIKCVKNRTSSPIAYLNSVGEEEVISHSKAQWTVLNVQVTEKGGGGKNADITVIECGEYASGPKGDGIMNNDDGTEKKTKEEPEPKPMLDRWVESSGDFKAYPPKKEYRKNSSESKYKKN